jgi:hypothetical protein
MESRNDGKRVGPDVSGGVLVLEQGGKGRRFRLAFIIKHAAIGTEMRARYQAGSSVQYAPFKINRLRAVATARSI